MLVFGDSSGTSFACGSREVVLRLLLSHFSRACLWQTELAHARVNEWQPAQSTVSHGLVLQPMGAVHNQKQPVWWEWTAGM